MFLVLLFSIILSAPRLTVAICVIQPLPESVRKLKQQQLSERRSRIRAEVALREVVGNNTPKQEATRYNFRPEGFINSCFRTRNGTPRPSLLVKEARSRLLLHADIPRTSFEELREFAHIWIIYPFHLNTNLHGRLTGKHFKAKVKVPRLDGLKVGVFATRTPHRFNNIGLSVAEIIQVNDRDIELAGLDVVDGTPVLDIKPYLPEYDCLPSATCPDWIAHSACAPPGPLLIEDVRLSSDARHELYSAWSECPHGCSSNYREFESFFAFIRSALSTDIRSLNERRKSTAEHKGAQRYSLWVENVLLEYVVTNENVVDILNVKVQR